MEDTCRQISYRSLPLKGRAALLRRRSVKPQTLIALFIYSAGAILLCAGGERLLAAFGSSPALELNDPFFGIPLRYSALIIGAVELAGSYLCLSQRPLKVQLLGIGWLTGNFVLLWGGMIWMQIHPQATAIGSLNDPLLLTRGHLGFLLNGVLLYLILGSFCAITWVWGMEPIARRRRGRKGEPIKMSCPGCGVHIQFQSQNLGQRIPCPHCHTAIILRKAENLKMSCFFCKEHIEFPVHALGAKLKCPHCNRDITLKAPALAASPRIDQRCIANEHE